MENRASDPNRTGTRDLCDGIIFGAYGLVNLYNLSKHSPANTLGEFLIPLLSDSYMVDILHLDLPMYPSAYMGVIVLFLIGTVMGISTWFYPKQKNEGQVQLFFS